MSRVSLPLLLVLLIAGLAACVEGPSSFAAPEQRVALAQVSLNPQEAREMINRYRAKNGLQPVSLNPKLTEAARRHCEDLARHDRISHTGSDGSNPWKRVVRTGYKAKLAAENVGVGQRSLSEVFRNWQASPGHNRNLLLSDATQMGIALKRAPDTRYGTFWTLVLGTPM